MNDWINAWIWKHVRWKHHMCCAAKTPLSNKNLVAVGSNQLGIFGMLSRHFRDLCFTFAGLGSKCVFSPPSRRIPRSLACIWLLPPFSTQWCFNFGLYHFYSIQSVKRIVADPFHMIIGHGRHHKTKMMKHCFRHLWWPKLNPKTYWRTDMWSERVSLWFGESNQPMHTLGDAVVTAVLTWNDLRVVQDGHRGNVLHLYSILDLLTLHKQ